MYNDNKYVRMTIDALRGEGLPKIKFNMAYVFFKEEYECGTSACIAGHIAALFDAEHGTSKAPVYQCMSLDDSMRQIGQLAGMTDEEAASLFYPHELLGELSMVEAEEAADVLEQYAQTGIIDWSGVVERIRAERMQDT